MCLTLPASIDPSYFPIARKNPPTICPPESFLYLEIEGRRNKFSGTSSKPMSEKSYLEIRVYLKSNLQFQGWICSEMPLPIYH